MTDFIQYSILPTESGIILVELNTQTMTFRKIVSNDDIMEAKTRPKYNEFLKEWSEKNKITSFFGSDKAEFLQDWNNVKTGGGAKKAEPSGPVPMQFRDTSGENQPLFSLVEQIARIRNPEVEAVAEPVVAATEQQAKVGDTIYSDSRFFRIMKLTSKTVTLKPLLSIVTQVKDDKKSLDSQNEVGIEIIKPGEPIDEEEQSGKTRTKLKTSVDLTKRDSIVRKYDSYRGN